MPKGNFIVMKTGCHPMVSKLKLFFKWGIIFDEENPYRIKNKSERKVSYTGKDDIIQAILKSYPQEDEYEEEDYMDLGKTDGDNLTTLHIKPNEKIKT